MKDVFKSITMILGIAVVILVSCISFVSCGGIDDTSAIRSSADIRAEQYHYLDDEAIALSDSMTDTGLRAVAYEAFNEVNDIRAKAGVVSRRIRSSFLWILEGTRYRTNRIKID